MLPTPGPTHGPSESDSRYHVKQAPTDKDDRPLHVDGGERPWRTDVKKPILKKRRDFGVTSTEN